MPKNFSTSVVISKELSSSSAGSGIGKKIINELGKEVSFVILLSTIHYEKLGGFETLLKSVYEFIPKNVHLIGGTVPGFITSEGCFTRGVAALAVKSPEMDVATGVGFNTKRNPKKAAGECARGINNKLSSSKFKKSFLFSFVSGPTALKLPIIGGRRVIKAKLLGSLLTKGVELTTLLLQKGVGRESEIHSELNKLLPEYYRIGGSTLDDNKVEKNYEFLNDKVYSNSIVALGLKTDINFGLNSTTGLSETPYKFNVTDTAVYGCGIKSINFSPALNEFLGISRWSESYLDERIHRKTLFTPLGSIEDGKVLPATIGWFMGDTIICSRKISKGEVSMLSASGNNFINAYDKSLSEFSGNSNKLFFIVGCTAVLESLGHNVYKIKDKIEEKIGSTPFLMVFTGGEDIQIPNGYGGHLNESFNVAAFW